ncbi:NUDIX hydrolase [Allonocardiopsis opalescens]|uniref:ADP-ribose pyrophosphatase YjhB (NUDIX family) n=1 Tax=Allonocardiopsis opalescens TaxID=1144618 RepID=A0A2T0Q7H7_9ACTN|nr:NUDIX hydrolase [Allonocardiopsis opalescens]PRX99776.1 ADP-ribose pyrophosphatase YjhB (NUDIX family) [Allonocardiopsis opalescens]
MSERDGDGWVTCGRGHQHWGRFGAAGLLIHHRGPGGVRVVLQHRALWSHLGGTWGIPGGARDSHETAPQAAVREVAEEVVADLSALRTEESYVVDHGGWTYTTVLASLPEPVPVAPGSSESTAIAWVELAEVGRLKLHPGFAASWPLLSEALRGR